MGCIICTGPREKREVINQMLWAKIPLRQIAAETGTSRATLSRHSIRCLLRSQAQRAKLFDAKRGRILARIFGKLYRPADLHSDCGSPATELPANEIRCDDVVVALTLRSGHIKNPSALIIGQQFSAGRKLEFRLKVTSQAATVSAEASQTTQEPAEPSQAAAERAIAPEPILREQSHPQEPVELACEHELKNVSGNVWRCLRCGWQKPTPKPFGVGFDFLSRKKSMHGRFG